MSRRVCRGFAVVELIVVLTVLLMLAALVLPAVQQARETARRTQCRAKLSQIALALHNDQHAHGVLPPGCVNRTGPIRNQVEGYHFGWMTQIVPMLQRTAVWNQFDFDRSVYDRGNRVAAMASLSEFFCPSYRFTKGAGESTYGGVHHDLEAPVDVDQSGVLFLNSAIRDEDIPDGLSHTAFVGECDVATYPLGDTSQPSRRCAIGAARRERGRRAWPRWPPHPSSSCQATQNSRWCGPRRRWGPVSTVSIPGASSLCWGMAVCDR
jgi:type II secretory pathway pseudopilin PulG